MLIDGVKDNCHVGLMARIHQPFETVTAAKSCIGCKIVQCWKFVSPENVRRRNGAKDISSGNNEAASQVYLRP